MVSRLAWLLLIAADARCGNSAATSCPGGAVSDCAAWVAEDVEHSALFQVAPTEKRVINAGEGEGATTAGAFNKIEHDSAADDSDDNSYCLGKISDVPPGIFALYNKCRDDYPVVPAVELFDMPAFVGRFFVAGTSEASKAVAYQCRCPAIDVGYAGPSGFVHRWNWQVTMRPDDEDQNRHVINPLRQYDKWSDKRKPQVFKDPLDGNAPAKDFVPDPLYTCVVVKTGPVVKRLGGYLYYVLSCEKLPGDTGLPILPSQGTFTFEVYTRDLEVFFEGYNKEVEAFIAKQTQGNPCTSAALKLVWQNHTGCTYPYEPAYTVTSKWAAAVYQKQHKIVR
uniref:Uncharacterized protein n=1 Tax=Pyrodinium bahamense TaxID=73915 RepID=A0A7R9ZUI9_9DINO|mmetsp:Transcript_10200/g.28480  ORF Transcript_10200/g.28480 Transcript_10200/m.28480 type:complete len:337 (+) Transcript_10200:80-1090(+)|eukprot:CAMPEP_0179044784 /NCGR_PEP_ID=MMETSP0796-20121207/17847_1 /TAXON_ID=73915 /ORGANISM="Pyrodinium bahamense, Strain pbaha01" /LENGTH=336 /DNA_ID=CAMNT_0020741183 /DNA_START=74 /DNA_END=1084 /DNA_ORIENTATION=-